jgi:hypothetical protein
VKYQIQIPESFLEATESAQSDRVRRWFRDTPGRMTVAHVPLCVSEWQADDPAKASAIMALAQGGWDDAAKVIDMIEARNVGS